MRVVKFGVVGVANTALDLALFAALTFGAKVAPWLANIVSYSSGIALSFLLNRRWTFGDRVGRRPAGQLGWFIAGNLVGLAISTAVIAGLLSYLGPLPAKIVSIGASFLWNFGFSNRIVFRR